MPELNTEQPEEIIKLNSVWYHSVKSGYLDDFPRSLVLYVETAYDLQVNQVIAGNLDKIQKIYKTYDQAILYLPLLLQEDRMFLNIFTPERNLIRR